jgi:hypothetical protein
MTASSAGPTSKWLKQLTMKFTRLKRRVDAIRWKLIIDYCCHCCIYALTNMLQLSSGQVHASTLLWELIELVRQSFTRKRGVQLKTCEIYSTEKWALWLLPLQGHGSSIPSEYASYTTQSYRWYGELCRWGYCPISPRLLKLTTLYGTYCSNIHKLQRVYRILLPAS